MIGVNFVTLCHIFTTSRSPYRKSLLKFNLLQSNSQLLSLSTNERRNTMGLQNSSSNITFLMDECSNMRYVSAHTAVSLVQIVVRGFVNGLVIFLLSTNRHLLRIPSNVILLTLSIWDFFACLVVVPYNIHVMYTYDRKSV